MARNDTATFRDLPEYLQQDQPPGVPPLALTGERTLPDLPEENYWFRRHLVVYEWLARRCRGLRVADLACGEGYGSEVLARSAASVVGVELLGRFAALAPVSYVSTPNRLTLAPPGAEKSENPWHLREYTIAEYRELLEPHFSRVEVLGLFHARKLRAHELAIRLGWDRVHRALRITKPFYDRFTPTIAASDFALREDGLERALDFVAICHA
jgi:hypothetical protein